MSLNAQFSSEEKVQTLSKYVTNERNDYYVDLDRAENTSVDEKFMKEITTLLFENIVELYL